MTNPPPDDVVLFHILPRLPTKSLLRFRCVCKSWNSFILDPSFLQLRRSATRTHGHLLFVCPSSAVAASEPHVFSAPLFEGQADMAPSSATHVATLSNRKASSVDVQCVNGLLCFHPKNAICFSSCSDAFVQICNPTTGKTFTLPDDTSITNKFNVSTHFGYDPVGDQFKVLRLVSYRDSHEFRIFTVGDTNNSWRHVTPTMRIKPFWFLEGKRGLWVNGAIHWKIFSNIMAFDLGNEQFRVIKIPAGYSYKGRHIPHLKFPDLVELSGCLSLVGYSDSVLNLWILKDYEAQEWVQKSIELPSGIGEQERVHFPLCRVPSGEILLVPYFVARRVGVIYHNMEKMSSRRAFIMEMPQPLWPDQKSGDVDIFFHQESFRLLKSYEH